MSFKSANSQGWCIDIHYMWRPMLYLFDQDPVLLPWVVFFSCELKRSFGWRRAQHFGPPGLSIFPNNMWLFSEFLPRIWRHFSVVLLGETVNRFRINCGGLTRMQTTMLHLKLVPWDFHLLHHKRFIRTIYGFRYHQSGKIFGFLAYVIETALSVALLYSASAGPGAGATCICKQDNAHFS